MLPKTEPGTIASAYVLPIHVTPKTTKPIRNRWAKSLIYLVAWGGIEGSAAGRIDPENSVYGVTFSTAILTPVRVFGNGSIATLLKN